MTSNTHEKKRKTISKKEMDHRERISFLLIRSIDITRRHNPKFQRE